MHFQPPLRFGLRKPVEAAQWYQRMALALFHAQTWSSPSQPVQKKKISRFYTAENKQPLLYC
jgi:hypothetical protein